MSRSFESTPSPVVTSTTEAVVNWRASGATGGGHQEDRIAVSRADDSLAFYVENQDGAITITAQVYGLMNKTDAPLTKGVPMLATARACVAGERAAILLAPPSTAMPFYALGLDAASGAPTARCFCTVKSPGE